MKTMMKTFLSALLAPRLYNIHRQRDLYKPNIFETRSEKCLMMTKLIKPLSICTIPVGCWYYWHNGFLATFELALQLFASLGCVYFILLLIRAFGRMKNPQYIEFLRVINNNEVSMDLIRKYDFEMSAWPVTYAVPRSVNFPFLQQYALKMSPEIDMPLYKRILIMPLAYIITHVFAIHLVYPGTISLVQLLINTSLIAGRNDLVKKYSGIRNKIICSFGNEIDTMFVDKRNRNKTGNTLVICCEGNTGFYEIGIMETPIRAGYSVLGWNHPGFAGSTGNPYPEQEHSAIDAIIDFAMELGFRLENIVLYGWSIGGYAALWAGIHYPDIKAIVLDAPFDDIIPLARKAMPKTISPVVDEVIRSYINLNLGKMIADYNGKIALVRRTYDEIVFEGLNSGVENNCANKLVLRLIYARHPNLSQEDKTTLENYVRRAEKERRKYAKAETSQSTAKILELISRYLHEFDSMHCTPLPEENFENIMDSLNI